MKSIYFNWNIYSTIFFLAAASYRGPGEDEDVNSYAARIAFTGNSRVLGPICIAVGAIMLSLGILLCYLARGAKRNEQRVAFHCPLHGDFYPVSPIHGSLLKLFSEYIYTYLYYYIFVLFKVEGHY